MATAFNNVNRNERSIARALRKPESHKKTEFVYSTRKPRWSGPIPLGLRISDFRFRVSALIAVALLVITGCESPSGPGLPSKPSTGIRDYRHLTKEARKAVAATVDSLEALAGPCPKDSKPHPAIARLDRTLGDLELTALKTRSKAEAIIARGEAYFDEWKAQLAINTNGPAARADKEDYARLHEHFVRVRERSAAVRSEFQPFMAKLREFRAAIGGAPCPTDKPSVRTDLEALTASGKHVLDTLGGVAQALHDAEVALRASHAPKQ